MSKIILHKIKTPDLNKIIKENRNPLFIIEKSVDIDLLEYINRYYSNIPININLECSDIIGYFTHLTNFIDVHITLPYDNIFENISFIKDFQYLKSLKITNFSGKKISFKPIEYITNLRELAFDGIDNRGQYKFINQQNNLKKLYIRKIDLNLVKKNNNLELLQVGSTIKSEKLLAEKFSNLRNLNLHGCSRLKNHSFINELNFIEDITINYNSHIIAFPKLKNPELIKRIVLLTCPNFSDIESIISFVNLETFCLTSYDKQLQVPVCDFQKLKALKKLKRVYTVWGRRRKVDLDIINKVYEETNWINRMN